MFRTFRLPISWTELLKRTLREAQEDNVLGLAAQLAFYFLLALVPALLFLIALASFFPVNVVQDLVARAAAVAPPEVTAIIRNQLQEIAAGRNTGLLTFGIAAALWSSSSAIVAITDALNRAYDIEESRPWWKVRLTAILLTIGTALFVLVSVMLVIAGPELARWIASTMGLGAAFEWTWKIVQWPLVVMFIAFGIAMINYFAPDAEQDWEWLTPGALLSTVLWLIASLGFRIYVTSFGNYNETYGSLGGIIVLMLWFYMSGIALLLGAEMNAEIEHASEYGKAPGEKVPGQRKKLGAAAAREYEARKRERAMTLPPEGASPSPGFRPQSAFAREHSFSDYALGFSVLVTRFFVRRRRTP